MGKWSLHINEACPSVNKFSWSHWRVAKESKDRWKMLIRAADGFLSIPKAAGPRRLTIERIGWKKLDRRNLLAGAKGIIDSLVQHKLLVNDTEEWYVEGDPIQRLVDYRNGEAPHTILHLEDLDA